MPNYIGSGKGSGGNESAEKSFGVWVERSPVRPLAWVSNLYRGLLHHTSQEETVSLNAKGMRALRRGPGKKGRGRKGGGREGGRKETITSSLLRGVGRVTDLGRLLGTEGPSFESIWLSEGGRRL